MDNQVFAIGESTYQETEEMNARMTEEESVDNDELMDKIDETAWCAGQQMPPIKDDKRKGNSLCWFVDPEKGPLGIGLEQPSEGG